MSEEKLIEEIYDLTLQNNTARDLDDAFLQGIQMAVYHINELNLLRLNDVSNCNCKEYGVNNTTNKCINCGSDWKGL